MRFSSTTGIDPRNLKLVGATAADLQHLAALVDNMASGAGLPGMWGRQMTTFRSAAAARATNPINIAGSGDSRGVAYFAGTIQQGWFQRSMNRLEQVWGQQQTLGYVPVAQAGGTGGGYTGAYWGGTIQPRYDSGLGYTCAAIATGQTGTFTFTGDRYWILYSRATSFLGPFFIKDNGATVAASISEVGGPDCGNLWDSGQLTRGVHTITVGPTGAFSSIIDGIVVFDGNGGATSITGLGLRHWNCFHYGHMASDQVPSGATANWSTALATINPDLVMIPFGVNERLNAQPPATFRAQLGALISKWSAYRIGLGQPPPSILLFAPYVTLTPNVLADAYSLVPYLVASDFPGQVAVLDEPTLFSYVGTAAGGDPWQLTADHIHPNNTGHAMLGDRVADFLLEVAGLPRAAQTKAHNYKTANYTLTSSDDVIEGDTTGGAFTITLPTPVGIATREYTVVRVNAGANNLTVTAAANINGAANFVLAAQWSTVTVMSDGFQWIIKSSRP